MTTATHQTENNTIDPWLTVRGCAERGDCHEATVRRMIRAGRVRYARVGLGGKGLRIKASWWDAAMEANSVPVEVSR